MPPQEHQLTIETREKTGSRNSHALRNSGKVPATLYGHGSQPQNIAFDARAFEDLMHHGARNALIQLKMDGRNADTALVRDIQRDPVTRRVIHADLQRVSANEEIAAKVPVVTTGVAVGVRDSGGVLDVIMHELEIEGPANKMPVELQIDVSGLDIHDHITAAEVSLPQGFKMLTPAETLVVGVESSKTAAQLEEAAAPAEQAEPEIIGATPEPTPEA